MVACSSNPINMCQGSRVVILIRQRLHFVLQTRGDFCLLVKSTSVSIGNALSYQSSKEYV